MGCKLLLSMVQRSMLIISAKCSRFTVITSRFPGNESFKNCSVETNDVCIKSPAFLTEFNRREGNALLLKKQAMAHFYPQPPPILIILVAEQQEKSTGQCRGSRAL